MMSCLPLGRGTFPSSWRRYFSACTKMEFVMLDTDTGSLLGHQTHSLESFGSEVHLDAIDGRKGDEEEGGY